MLTIYTVKAVIVVLYIINYFILYIIYYIIWNHIPEDELRRPGQRLPTAMMGNEVMSKEQLYDLFQQILNVKKFEHQLLYNAMQVELSV